MLLRLRNVSKPIFNVAVGQVPATDVYILDEQSLTTLRGQ
jgi:hypothetical protein